MKKIGLVLLILLTFIGSKNVRAAETTMRVVIKSSSGNSANVREKPSTKANRLAYAQVDSIYNVVTDATFKDLDNYAQCKADWYQIYYNGVATGYVCGENAEVVTSYRYDGEAPQDACEQELANQGFPSTYWGELCRLKTRHPTWTFLPLRTNLSWQAAIEGESACGWNKIYKTDAGEPFIDNSCTLYNTGNFVSVRPAGIAYYMDPRNWLAERTIFQFLQLSYDANFETIYNNATNQIIKDTEFYKYHLGNNVELGGLINNVGKNLNVSPIFTSARIKQELGSDKSEESLYSGTYIHPISSYTDPATRDIMVSRFGEDGKRYYGYYNFYNFGVSDSCVNSYGVAYCGLSYAAKEVNNWNTPERAIEGGVKQLAQNYIQQNQYTTYLQKFNVIETDGRTLYSHQYMTNVAAPSSESATTYSTYKDLGIMEQAFIFYIPIYEGMDATISNVGNGAQADGNTAPNPSSIPIPTIVTSSGHKYQSGYISGIEVGSDVAQLKASLESVGGNSTVYITDASGNGVAGVLKTGYKVTINNQSTSETLEVVIKGDTSGDGIVNALDLLQIQKNILGLYSFSGAYSLASDTSNDGATNALDLLQVQKNILGLYTIVQ